MAMRRRRLCALLLALGLFLPSERVWATPSSRNDGASKANDSGAHSQGGNASWWGDMDLDDNGGDSQADSCQDQGMTEIGGHLDKTPLLQIPCALIVQRKEDGHTVIPLVAVLDTTIGPSRLRLTGIESARTLEGFIRHLQETKQRNDSREAVLFRFGSAGATIPLSSISLESSNGSYADTKTLQQVDGTQVQLRLGLDFLNAHRAIIDIVEGELVLHQTATTGLTSLARIPFIRPRASVSFIADSESVQ